MAAPAYHVDYAVIALRIGWAQKESRVGDEGQGIMHNALRNLTVAKANLNPEPLDLRIALEELELHIIGFTFQRFHKKERLRAREINDFPGARREFELYLRGEALAGKACRKRIERLRVVEVAFQ